MKAFTALLLLAAASLPAFADATADCNRFENPQLQIKGCTSFIRKGSLQTEMLSMAYTNRGIALGNLGRVEKAISDFSEAIRLDPKSPLAFYNRGNAYLDKKKLDWRSPISTPPLPTNPSSPSLTTIAASSSSSKASASFASPTIKRP